MATLSRIGKTFQLRGFWLLKITPLVFLLFTGCFEEGPLSNNPSVSRYQKPEAEISVLEFTGEVLKKDTKYRISAKSEEDCKSKNGKWTYLSKGDALSEIKTCIYKNRDAGKSCTDGDQCESGVCQDSQLRNGLCARYTLRGSNCQSHDYILIRNVKTRLTGCEIID